jgi:hypothetical protein
MVETKNWDEKDNQQSNGEWNHFQYGQMNEIKTN